MKRIFLRLKQPLRNERGEITFFACFFVVGIVMLISFLLLYASIRITCINIRNGAKMELNNLSGTIYADTYRSQRETNFEEYLNTLYSSSDYTDIPDKFSSPQHAIDVIRRMLNACGMVIDDTMPSIVG